VSGTKVKWDSRWDILNGHLLLRKRFRLMKVRRAMFTLNNFTSISSGSHFAIIRLFYDQSCHLLWQTIISCPARDSVAIFSNRSTQHFFLIRGSRKNTYRRFMWPGWCIKLTRLLSFKVLFFFSNSRFSSTFNRNFSYRKYELTIFSWGTLQLNNSIELVKKKLWYEIHFS
jgi:hypothetical protein